MSTVAGGRPRRHLERAGRGRPPASYWNGRSRSTRYADPLVARLATHPAYLFDGNLPSDQAFIHTFGFGGTFEYRCNNHATMTGSVVVNCLPGDLVC